MNIELKENEYLILHSDEIKHLEEIENDELEGHFETSSGPLTPTNLLIRAVSIYMASNGQLVRGIDCLLRDIQDGIERAVDDMEETKNLDYGIAICLIEDLYQSKIK